MLYIQKASIEYLDEIIQIDFEVIANTQRLSYIKESVTCGHCIVAKSDSETLGFLTFTCSFFEHLFIDLLIVRNNHRRKGVGSALLNSIKEHAPTEKIFSSTNESNHDMRSVFLKNGFIESGVIDNLDEGDPEMVFFKLRSK